MGSYAIECRDLTKRIGRTAVVDQINLQINKGDIYGFLGPNGAGKTTTIRMLLGLMTPTRGSIRIFGKDMQKERIAVLRKVGSLVEYPSYYGHLNAYENLEAVRRILGVPKARIDEVLSIVRLTKEAGRAVKGFSLGMKQRLGIATALLGQPELLILDEPTNGLDPSGILEIRELLKRMPTEFGVTILVSSHLLAEMDQMATKVGIITKGKLIFQDTIEVLRQRAKSHIRMEVDTPDFARQLIRAQGIHADLHGGKLLLDSASNMQIADIVKQLVQNQVSVYRVEEQSKSLEEIFLELTGGEGGL
ncbi:ABC transporter ATP-binding protein [Paenibacillus eucommiae]|uniref:ABC-2 type transport system ATP-binding protein n=1 Tax=Paenibacillus eucommiae TaxID=1355755 RepID=A0ABS4IWJ0_9BACL|nr:ABC transporter ATP-binding protein [Paenibacillus eucommiae]MBP1991450.1 ABC-2 type transport system ATP-binding protein [Paenibacillus eucommiae]